MSNKLRNILVKALLLLLIMNAVMDLYCYEPEAEDFKNIFQYKLYQSWLKKGEFRTNFPAGFGNRKIVKSFLDRNGNTVQVEYDWIDRKITDQRESLPIIFFVEDFSKIKPFLNYLEGFVYRLNTIDFIYLQEYCDLDKFQIGYSRKSGFEALKYLWEENTEERVKTDPMELEVNENNLIFSLPLKSGKTIKITFPVNYDIAIALQSVRRKEEKKSPPVRASKIELPIKTAIPKIEFVPRKRKPEPKIELLPEINQLTLAEYVKSYHAVRQSKELLHNKISDPVKFLLSEFPRREIREEAGTISILAPCYRDNFHCEIMLHFLRDKDGINFTPVVDYEVDKKIVKFGNYEEIRMNSLDSDEITAIVPFISQLVFEHRAIGTKLLNFLLIHDDIPTTLVMRDGTRQIFELDSYANLLLMLGNYWQSHDIYFKVQEVTKKNGNIEFQTFLIADNRTKKETDMAEILFHLDDEYKIDMIMMILHQGSKAESKSNTPELNLKVKDENF